jgi:uncharacterized protein (DUF362 family)/Pyruvate/2-oxoacid:ferredoxin oxidoreductase delta subunit
MPTIVSIVRCPDYEPELVSSAVTTALELAELDVIVRESEITLLKPNLLSTRTPDEAVTTHPSVVRALGRYALERDRSVTLGDSPPFAGENPIKYARLCEMTGMTALASELEIPIVRFEEDVTTVSNPEGRFYRSFEVARRAIDADVLVNIPKLKTHGLTTFSGAVKNIFGCVPGVRKGLFHVQAAENTETFAQMLVDLLRVFKPRVYVIDAIVAMEGEGPNAGTPRHVGLILASPDAVALDAVASALIGIDPMSIDTTRLAHEQGLGCGDINSIAIRGERIEDVRLENFKLSSGRNDWNRIPAPIRMILRRQLVAAPKIRSAKCIGCGGCVRVCPVRAITAGKAPSINLTECIRCYCCHEVCNLSAIDLKRGWLGELALRGFRKR